MAVNYTGKAHQNDRHIIMSEVVGWVAEDELLKGPLYRLIR